MRAHTMQRAVRATTTVSQKNLGEYGMDADEPSYRLDCESCGQSVDVPGGERDAAIAADLHLTNRVGCLRVRVHDRQTNEADVFVADIPTWVGQP